MITLCLASANSPEKELLLKTYRDEDTDPVAHEREKIGKDLGEVFATG